MSWKTVCLGQVARIERKSIAPATISSGVRYVGLENIESGGELVGVDVVEPGDLASSKFVFSNAHILYGKLRPYLAKIAAPEFNGICSTEILPILPGPGIDRRYLLHFLRLPESIELATRRSSGANLPRLNPKELEKFAVPLPPLAEQRRIAGILDKVDTLRALQANRSASLAQLRSAFLREMVGSLQIGSGWDSIRVDEAGSVRLGRQRSPKYQTGSYSIPYMRVANVHEDRIDTSDVLVMDFDGADRERYSLRHGDILLNEGQSTELVGRPAMWRNEIDQCCYQNTLVRFRCKPDVCLPEFALAVFLEYFLNGEFARISSKTSNVAHLGAARFASLPFPRVAMDLQAEFVQRVRIAQRQRVNVDRGAGEYGSLYASLQSRAFRGEL